jgi:L-asparaginase II
VNDPLVVEVTRGSSVESRHLVDVALVDAVGKTVDGWGEFDRPTLARSSLKPIQATPLIAEGIADAAGLTNEQLAIACSSHNGEARHVQVVDHWLETMGMSHRVLECGAHFPGDPVAARDLVLARRVR